MALVDSTIKALVGDSRNPDENTIEYICTMEGFSAYEDIIRAKYQGVSS